jgi:hypothetical protein
MKDDVLFESLSEIPSAIKDDSEELIEIDVRRDGTRTSCVAHAALRSSSKFSIEFTCATSAAVTTNERKGKIQFENVE